MVEPAMQVPRVKVCCIASVAEAELAIAVVRPFGVNLCTGVREVGTLSAGKLRAFMAAMRGGASPGQPHLLQPPGIAGG